MWLALIAALLLPMLLGVFWLRQELSSDGRYSSPPSLYN